MCNLFHCDVSFTVDGCNLFKCDLLFNVVHLLSMPN
jgi:hypothetical protein